MRRRHLLTAFWNLRVLAFLMIGPALGLALVHAVFGLAPGLGRLAWVAAPLALAPFALLVHAEYARLSGPASKVRRSA